MPIDLSVQVKVPKGWEELRKLLDDKTILEAVGMRTMRWINDNFEAEGLEKKWRPHAASTAERRSGKLLQNTGATRQSFGYRVTDKEVWIGSKHPIAVYHHHGTKPYTIRPKNAKALRFHIGGKERFFAKVNHPGLPARPLLPSKAVFERFISEMLTAMAEKALGES